MITNPDDGFYERVTSRIFTVMLAIAGVGTLVALVWRGWSVGAGFALGSTISWINFRWLKHAVDSLNGKSARGWLCWRGSATCCWAARAMLY
jgi:hypothetical protein